MRGLLDSGGVMVLFERPVEETFEMADWLLLEERVGLNATRYLLLAARYLQLAIRSLIK